MTDHVLKAETGHINFSPAGFRLAARDFFDCYFEFKPAHFSVVPFFLCCRAIELALKATHLETQSQVQVKKHFSHDLEALYDDLPPEKRTLSAEEVTVLARASTIYNSDKAFEYIRAADAATAYTRFPEVDALAQIASKVLSYDA
jgi:hypothetical protein